MRSQQFGVIIGLIYVFFFWLHRVFVVVLRFFIAVASLTAWEHRLYGAWLQ